jgi:protein-S-isoprenylcysteine O-methyltransferase Ste14
MTMQYVYEHLFYALWITWGLYWIASARGLKSPVRRESTLSRWAHYGPLILAGWLLSDGGRIWWPLRVPFIARTEALFWIAAAMTAAGLAFAIWARRHLGRNWSGSVTIKADHELITTGPYRITRHPIYTGLLLAFAGTGLIVAEVRGIVAFAIAFAALWRKLRLEERFMREQFGPAYADYARRVAALVPFLL